MRRILPLVVIALAFAACSDDGGTETTISEPLAEPQCIQPVEEGTQPEFVGLTEDDARALADERNLEVREVGRDGECFPSPTTCATTGSTSSSRVIGW